MCLIVVGWRVDPDFPLVVAANRDEFHARSTAVANFWADAPEVIAGRDLEAGGTWLGITRGGRFAAVTNVREPGAAKGLHSRGRLTQAFLEGRQSAADHVGLIKMGDYSGFNLLVGDGQSLWYCSNRGTKPLELAPAWYVLVSPGVSIPTAEIFGAGDLTRNTPLIRMPDFAVSTTRNDLQAVACKRYPQVQSAIDWLGQHAPARMTGSGSCVFAEVASAQHADWVAAQCPPAWTAWKVRSSSRHPLFEWLE